MPNLRLCRETDADQPDPPAPLPFRADHTWRDTSSPREDAMDSIDYAQRALAHAENKLDELQDLWREEEQARESFVIQNWMPEDDDGPWVA